MRCARPFSLGVEEFGCGQCMPCRLNRRRLWTSRLMLEARLHEHSCFVTLTYSEENYPCDGSVSRRAAQLFLKRLRERIAPLALRYYIVGEYGDVTGRAHYHAALFGIGHESATPLHRKGCSCPICGAWTLGMVYTGRLEPSSASYVVSYVTKGLTRKGDMRLGVREPEFALMSLKPGIGAGAMEALHDALSSVEDRIREADVPGVVRQEGRSWPLGRYLRSKLREAFAMAPGEPVTPKLLRVAERFAEFGRFARVKDYLSQRDGKREQSARNARALNQIARSRKGIGQ